jgi:hypothetical protein
MTMGREDKTRTKPSAGCTWTDQRINTEICDNVIYLYLYFI